MARVLGHIDPVWLQDSPTGNGEKLSSSHAEPGQAVNSAVVKVSDHFLEGILWMYPALVLSQF